jgi:hypothetical protein
MEVQKTGPPATILGVSPNSHNFPIYSPFRVWFSVRWQTKQERMLRLRVGTKNATMLRIARAHNLASNKRACT